MRDNECESRSRISMEISLGKTLRRKLENLGIPPGCIGKPKFEFNIEMGASPLCIQGKATIPIVFFVKKGQPAEDINRERENTEFMKNKDPEHFVTPITIPPEEDGLLVAEFFEGDTLHSIILDESQSEELKLDVAKEVYRALFRLYEANMKDITVPVHKAHFKRIEGRLNDKINSDSSFSKYKFKSLVINDIEIPSAYVLLNEAKKYRDQLEARKATTVLGDSQPDNVLVKFAIEFRFVDLLNLDPEGDYSIDAGKNRHWLNGYIIIRKIRDDSSVDPKSYFKYNEYVDKDGKIIVNYDLKSRLPPIASKIYSVFLEQLKEFSERVGDDWWYERTLLGSTRAWIGGIPYHQSQEIAVIMLCEGLLDLAQCVEKCRKRLAPTDTKEVKT